MAQVRSSEGCIPVRLTQAGLVEGPMHVMPIYLYTNIYLSSCVRLYIYIYIIDIDIDILYIYMTGRRYIYTTLSRHSKKWRTRC